MSVSLSPKYRRMGFTEADAGYIEYFRRMAKGWNWSEADIEASIGYAAENQHRPLEEVERDFLSWSAHRGLSAVDADLALAWRERVAENGVPDIPPEPFTSADAARVREIEELLRTDRAAYERVADEYQELLIARQDGGAVTQRVAVASDRKAELERILRTDRREYFNAGHHEEYARILRVEAGEQVADNQPEPFPAQTPVNLEIPE